MCECVEKPQCYLYLRGSGDIGICDGPSGGGVAISLTEFLSLGPAEHEFCKKWLGGKTQCGIGSVVKYLRKHYV